MNQGQSGFSLVELLISIAIITVLLGVGVPAFRTYGRQSELRQAATDIQLALLQAHNLSLAPEADRPPTADLDVGYYAVAFDPAGGFRVVRGVDSRAIGFTISELSNPEAHTLPSGISFVSNPAPPNYIGYRVGANGGLLASPSGSLRISVISSRLPSGENTIDIDVLPVTGQVTIGKER